MHPPAHPGPDVDEVVERINQFSPRMSGRGSLPPISESANIEPVTIPTDPPAANAADAAVLQNEPIAMQPIKTPKPLPSIPPKQQSFNKALENITRYV